MEKWEYGWEGVLGVGWETKCIYTDIHYVLDCKLLVIGRSGGERSDIW